MKLKEAMETISTMHKLIGRQGLTISALQDEIVSKEPMVAMFPKLLEALKEAQERLGQECAAVYAFDQLIAEANEVQV